MMMDELIAALHQLATGERIMAGVRTVLLLVGGFVSARVVGRSLERMLDRRIGPQQAALARRLASYSIASLAVVMALRQLGFDLTALLGAAGIFTVAVGFAAQTSASNLISGLFLMGERSFGLGDVIRVGTTTGEVIGIDMLSVKLRTFDNLLVRLPNEMLVKSEITTLSHFPIRRADLKLGCGYEQDLEHMRAVLEQVAAANPLCLEEPRPQFIVEGYGDNAILVQFSVWTSRETFLDMRTALYFEIKRAFDQEGLAFPYPQRVVHHRPSSLEAIAASEASSTTSPRRMAVTDEILK